MVNGGEASMCNEVLVVHEGRGLGGKGSEGVWEREGKFEVLRVNQSGSHGDATVQLVN